MEIRVIFFVILVLWTAFCPAQGFPDKLNPFPGGVGLMALAPADTTAPPVIVRAINIFGNKKTKQYLVEREVAFETNTFYEPRHFGKLLRQTKEQLMNTSLFVTVELDIDTLFENEYDVNINLRERWYLFPLPHFKIVDRNLNVWINDYKASLERTELGAKIIHNNLTGRNDKMNLFFIGGYSQQIVANYYQPYFDKSLRQGFGVAFSLSRAREVNVFTDSNRQQFFKMPDFARRTIRGEVSYTYRQGSKMRSIFRVSYNQEDMDSAVIAQNPNMFGQGKTRAQFVDLFAGYQYFNVDYIPYPLRGWLVDFYALKRISGTIPMLQVGGKMHGTWKFAHKSYVGFQNAFAITLSNQEQPYYNSRMLGYRSLYMQGLEYYVADGTIGAMVRANLRREILAFTLHNLFRSKSHKDIPFQVFLKTYGNLGYAYNKNPGNNYMNNQLLRTAGLGMDIKMVYDLVLKLEYSFNQFGEHGFFIHTATDF